MLLLIILSTVLISAGALIGVFFLSLKRERLQRIVLFLVSFSAGTLMGSAFLHLLPESAHHLESDKLFLTVLLSFIAFYIIENIFHWRHCHFEECEVHSFGYINLIGDAIHNFIDGLIIAAAYVADPVLGMATTLAVAFHEIPQEIGDFGVLLHAGWSKQKALLANFGVALVSVLGGIVGYYLAGNVDQITEYLVPFAAGGFIYIAAADLLPEIRKQRIVQHSVLSFVIFLLGVGLMYGLEQATHEFHAENDHEEIEEAHLD